MQEKRELPGALKTLAGVVIVFLLLATGYVIYQAGQVLFPPNTNELRGRGRHAGVSGGRR